MSHSLWNSDPRPCMACRWQILVAKQPDLSGPGLSLADSHTHQNALFRLNPRASAVDPFLGLSLVQPWFKRLVMMSAKHSFSCCPSSPPLLPHKGVCPRLIVMFAKLFTLACSDCPLRRAQGSCWATNLSNLLGISNRRVGDFNDSGSKHDQQ